MSNAVQQDQRSTDHGEESASSSQQSVSAVEQNHEQADDSGGRATPETLTTDEALQLLSNKRRRYALHYLERNGPQVELGDLAETVAAWETGRTLQEIDSTDRKRVYTSLQSHHLPKMADQAIVEYDERSGIIGLTDQADELDIYLEVVEGKDVPWSQYYLALTAVNTAVLGAVALGLWPLTVVPSLAWAAFTVTSFAVSALVHAYFDSQNRLGTTDKPPELRET